MKNGQCSKCSSSNVLMAEGGAGFDTRINLQTKAEVMEGTRKWITYLCTNCGYFENYITDTDKLARIADDPARAGWRKVEG